jgi:hypothetical protein
LWLITGPLSGDWLYGQSYFLLQEDFDHFPEVLALKKDIFTYKFFWSSYDNSVLCEWVNDACTWRWCHIPEEQETLRLVLCHIWKECCGSGLNVKCYPMQAHTWFSWFFVCIRLLYLCIKVMTPYHLTVNDHTWGRENVNSS